MVTLILFVLCNFNVGITLEHTCVPFCYFDNSVAASRATFSPVVSNINPVLTQRATVNFNERIMQSYNVGRNLNLTKLNESINI